MSSIDHYIVQAFFRSFLKDMQTAHTITCPVCLEGTYEENSKGLYIAERFFPASERSYSQDFDTLKGLYTLSVFGDKNTGSLSRKLADILRAAYKKGPYTVATEITSTDTGLAFDEDLQVVIDECEGTAMLYEKGSDKTCINVNISFRAFLIN